MNLSRYEQETVITYNEEESTATVYTYNSKLLEKLGKLSQKYPDKIIAAGEIQGAAIFTVPKRCVCVREPYSEERRAADSYRAKSARLHPPDRSIYP